MNTFHINYNNTCNHCGSFANECNCTQCPGCHEEYDACVCFERAADEGFTGELREYRSRCDCDAIKEIEDMVCEACYLNSKINLAAI